MRSRSVLLIAVTATLVACDRSTPVAPASIDEVVDVVPDYALSAAAFTDAAGIGGSRFPDDLRLTAQQKAAIAALHDAFMKATAADVAALRAIERQAREARAEGKSREEIRAILARALPIRERLDAAFKQLQADVWAVYTPEQRAWIESHRPRSCGPASVRLTEEQVAKIRALQERFMAAVQGDLALIRSIVADAKAARAAGKSRQEVARILAQAAEPQRRVREAERALHEAILALLTPEQRERWLCRRYGGPG
ncbi:MAG TPA: Spy/CpxP family protein refolding chaperone [Gemmatimonadaceae bacterium]|nr:Spy/CpxP family protein refolding chaperone [Gemmatimonadaceae bacterium]